MERAIELKGRNFEHHIKRYEFVSKFVKDKIVCSVACGNGYGEYYLAKEGQAKYVYGMDISSDAIIYAKSHYIYPNLTFNIGTIKDSNLEDNSIDVFVSLETIEHIKDDEGFLKEIKRILKPDGFLIISTPNKASSFRDLFAIKPLNPFQVREYRKNEFDKILSKYFKNVKFFGQKTILRRSIFTIWRYLFFRFIGKIKNIEKENFDVVEYPNNKKFETAYFVVICRK